MERKAVQQGPATLSVSLPSKWVQKFNIKKGDNLFLEDQGDKLVISKKGINSEKKKMIIKTDETYDCSVLSRLINAAYISGYDELEIILHDYIFDYKSTALYFHSDKYKVKSTKVNVVTFINDILPFFIGFEIIHQSKNIIMIKELASTADVELATISKRLLLLAKEMGALLVEGFEKNDSSFYEVCNTYEQNINKFYRYFCRILNKTRFPEANKSMAIHQIISHIEEICDIYEDIIRNVFNKVLIKNIKINKEFIKMCQKTINLVNKFIGLFILNDKRQILLFYKENSNLILELEEIILTKQHPLSIELKQILFLIRESIQNYLTLDI